MQTFGEKTHGTRAPETNSELTSENWWLEDNSFLFESYFQRRTVSFRECKSWFVNLFDCSTDVLRLWNERNHFDDENLRSPSTEARHQAFHPWTLAVLWVPWVPWAAQRCPTWRHSSAVEAVVGRGNDWWKGRALNIQNSTDHIFYSHLFRPTSFSWPCFLLCLIPILGCK